MRKSIAGIAVATLLGACSSETAYEKAVKDYEPIYCYQSLAGVQCYKTPNNRDERRLVNFFGPAPHRYERPEPPPPPNLVAPPPVDFYVRDPEPVPHPDPPKRTANAPHPKDTDTTDPVTDRGQTPELKIDLSVDVSDQGLDPDPIEVVPAGGPPEETPPEEAGDI